MRSKHVHQYNKTKITKDKILQWGKSFDSFIYLDSNNYWKLHTSDVSYHNYDSIIAAGCIDRISTDSNGFNKLKRIIEEKNDWLFGYFSYDLKNEIENLKSENHDYIDFPLLQFFIPEHVIIIKDGSFIIETYEKNTEKIIEDISSQKVLTEPHHPINMTERFSKKEYIKTIKKILDHIQYGDIYEMNFCMEFFNNNAIISPTDIFKKLMQISPTPFACFLHIDGKYLLSASPERFIKKFNDKIISQPIKGTIKRGKSPEEDQMLKNQLYNDPKERSENVMIVDLVRNDLSRTAQKSSVQVEELFGIYSFTQVHQMISTISSKLHPDHHFLNAIKYAFPMGSMTGAPKIRSMELIEKYERSKRGLYSGSVGYFTPDGNFDFNVVIRSILYNASKKYLSFHVGGAITIKSDPEKEYEECLLKAKAMKEAIN